MMKFFFALFAAFATLSIVNSRSIKLENPRTDSDNTVTAKRSPRSIELEGSFPSLIEQKLAEFELMGNTIDETSAHLQKRSTLHKRRHHQRTTKGHPKRHNMAAFFYVPPNGK
ncbi:uncharacterized protein LOC134816781 [Bolinopsis microptera]|uniref:uncharacterized protein LOC134816781 n=1 Tax=Bolinopsis microptera TaxID=2820187 RepID=UPI00307AE59A